MTVPPNRDPIALLHSLEVHRAELELQNHELRAVNDELRRSNHALATARDHYLALHQLAPIAFVTIDRLGQIVSVNHAAEKLFVRSSAQLFERRLAVFVDESARPVFADSIRALFATGYLRGAETRLVLEDGDRPIHVVLDGVVLYDQEVRAVLAIVDVTAQKRMAHDHDTLIRTTEEARRRDDVRAFAGGVAHHVNLFLAGRTDAALSALGALVQQVLASSGTSAGAKTRCALQPIVDVVVPRITNVIETSIATDVPPILGDASQLELLLTNLLVNSAEAMTGRPGTIRIIAVTTTLTSDVIAEIPTSNELEPGPCIVLDIRDAGVGMDAVTMSRSFDPYFSTKGSGRGLGLVAVRGVVHGHKGAITMESNVGVGTRVRVYFPAAA